MELLLGIIIGIAYNNMPGTISEGDIVRQIGYKNHERVTAVSNGMIETVIIQGDKTFYYVYKNADNLILVSDK